MKELGEDQGTPAGFALDGLRTCCHAHFAPPHGATELWRILFSSHRDAARLGRDVLARSPPCADGQLSHTLLLFLCDRDAAEPITLY